MPIQTEIAVIQSIVYFIAFIAKIKMGNDDKHFKKLTIVFASFILSKVFIIPQAFLATSYWQKEY
jgi:hypothetical protein